MPTTVPLADLFTSENWFALLEVSLTGIQLLRPVYAPDGSAIADFAIAYLNPAAQRLTGLGEQPGGTLLGRFPHTLAEGLFQHYQRTFETGEPLTYETNYQADGLANHFKCCARRSGPHLLVSFTDTSDQDRAEAKRHRTSLQRSNEELEARAREVTTQVQEQQRLLHHVLEHVPAAIATLSGPEHRFTFANARYQYLVGHRVQVGLAVAEALPEVVEQGVIELLDRVYQTGEPFIGRNVMIMLEQPPAPPHQYYYDLTYLPLRDGQGQVQGILVFAVDVTEQVRARRQTTLLQAELLAGAQRRAQDLQDILQVFANAPLAVALLREPDHQLDYWNALLDQFFPGAGAGCRCSKCCRPWPRRRLSRSSTASSKTVRHTRARPRCCRARRRGPPRAT